MSVREVYLKVEEVLLNYQAEWDVAYHWLEDYGCYAEEYIRHGNVHNAQPPKPKTPLPKQRTTKRSVVANPLKNKMNSSLRRSAKLSFSKEMAVVDPPVEVLVDLTSDVTGSNTTALKGALQEISNVPLVNAVIEKSPKVPTIPLKSARAKRVLKKTIKEESRISTSPIRRITRSKMAKERLSGNTTTCTPSDDSSGSSVHSVGAPKKTGRKKKPVKKRISTERQNDSKAAYDTCAETTIGAATNGKDQSMVLTEDSATPKGRLISVVSTQEANKLDLSSNTPTRDGSQGTNTLKALPSKKQSIAGRQIFSPYGLDSTKKKAQAYENHIAQLAKISPYVTRAKNTRQSVAKRKSSGIMAGDRLSFAKAAKMSETQRRSSLTRYHLRVSTNQVIRKLSADKRRSSAGPDSYPADKRRSSAITPSSSVAVEHAIDTVDELDSPANRDLEKDSNENDDQFKSCQEMESEELDDKSDDVASGRKSSNDQHEVIVMESVSMKPAKVIVQRLSAEDIAKHVTKTSPLQASPEPARNLSFENSDETDSSDSYISADEAEDEVANMQSSTPSMSHPVKKKIFRPGKLIIRTNQLQPGSEPRPAQQSRAAYLAAMLNSSSNQSFVRAFGSTGSASSCGRPVTSFLGSRLTGRPPSFASAQKQAEKLREELKLKQEKEEQALKRRDMLLKNKVLNQKKKLDGRFQKAAENRLLKEREQQDKNRALEVQLQQAEEKKRLQAEKKREELEQKRIQRAKKEAEMEERRKQEEAAKLAKQREQEELEKIRMQEQLKYQQEQEKVKAMIQQHNSSLHKKAILNCTVTLEPEVLHKGNEGAKAATANMNQTYYCEKSVLSEKSELPVEESRNPENYDIGDLNSEDETDNEDSPRKKIPSWAQGNPLKAAVLKQIMNPPDLDKIFPPMPSLDIIQVFKNSKLKRRLIHRTSSAIWTSPIATQ